jgi:hypothetical protein
MFSSGRSWLVAAMIIAGVLGAIGCGGDDKGSGTDRDRPAASTPQSPVNRDVGDTNGSSSDGDVPRSAQEPFRPPPGSEQERLYDEVTAVYQALRQGIAPTESQASGRPAARRVDQTVKKVCNMLSKAALEQIQRTSPSLNDDPKTACRESLGVHLGRSSGGEGPQQSASAEIVGMEVDGDRATAKVIFGDGPPRSVLLVKEAGRWKLDAVPTGS